MTENIQRGVVRQTIVHVDDEPAWGWTLRRDFDARNFTYVQATSIGDALNVLEDETVVAVIVDWCIPGRGSDAAPRNTEQLIAYIKQRRPRLPIIALTNFDFQFLIYRLVEQGVLAAEDIYSKSRFDEERFVQHVISRAVSAPSSDRPCPSHHS
jgi:DNA-binding NtrC family response regulator